MLCHVKISHFWNFPLFTAHVLPRVSNVCFSVMPPESLLVLTDLTPLIDCSSREQIKKIPKLLCKMYVEISIKELSHKVADV